MTTELWMCPVVKSPEINWTSDFLISIWLCVVFLRPLPFILDWFHGLSDHLMILGVLCLTAGLFAWCVRIGRLLVGFRMHFKSLHFHFISFPEHLWQQEFHCYRSAGLQLSTVLVTVRHDIGYACTNSQTVTVRV